MSEMDKSLERLGVLFAQPVPMLVLLGIALVFSLAYTLKPEWFLKHKYIYEEIPEDTIKVAKAVGAVLSVALAAGIVYYLYRLIAG